MADTSTGIVKRPSGTTTLRIIITNNTANLIHQTMYIYSHNNNNKFLINVKNYIVQPNNVLTSNFPLVSTAYGDSYSIDFYEVVYGPSTNNVIVSFENI